MTTLEAVGRLSAVALVAVLGAACTQPKTVGTAGQYDTARAYSSNCANVVAGESGCTVVQLPDSTFAVACSTRVTAGGQTRMVYAYDSVPNGDPRPKE